MRNARSLVVSGDGDPRAPDIRAHDTVVTTAKSTTVDGTHP